MSEEELEVAIRGARRRAIRLTAVSLVCGAIGIAGILASDAITASLFFCVVALAVGLGARFRAREAGQSGRVALAAAALGLVALGLWTFKLFSVVDDARQIRQTPPVNGR
ncbi:MAG: hypothetical protein ACRDV9_03680 [Acidimicrobiia bacterium]